MVIAVIGPGWVTELKKRARKAGEVDYVRQELAQALAPKVSGAARRVIPVQMGGAEPVTAKALGAAFQADLGALARCNSVDFAGANWEAGYQRVAAEIAPIQLSRQGGDADHAALSAAVAKTLRETLARPEMQDFAARWDLNENHGVFASPVADLLADFSLAIRTVAQAWRAAPSKAPADAVREQLPQRCREMAVAVLTLAVDPVAAREWVKSGESAPCDTVGIAALVRAVAVGETIAVDPGGEGIDFRPQRVYALDTALDRGAAQKYRAQVGRGLWNDAYPKPPVGEMTDELGRKLALRIKTLTHLDKRSFVVTARIKDPSHRGELTDLANPFNAVGLGREASAASTERSILREPEDELVDTFCLCLEAIEQLP